MRRGVLFVALLVACAGCVKEHQCRDGTVFLTVKFSDSSDLVDGVALSYLLDNGTGTPSTIFSTSSPLARPLGKDQGGLELQVANYADHSFLTLKYVPTENDSPVGEWQKDTITLDRGCSTLTLQVKIKTIDGAVVGMDAGGGASVGGSGGNPGTGGSSGTGGTTSTIGGRGGTTSTGCATCSTGLVCERYPPAACLDPNWDEWPMPNGATDVVAGAPNGESYIDNRDGTVTDTVTDLMWQQAVSTTTTYEWTDAIAYCSALTLAGYGDWRLPSRIELFSIADLGQSNPSIDGKYFPSTPPFDFWSSSPVTGTPGTAWVVDFYHGYTNNNGIQLNYYVRCVR